MWFVARLNSKVFKITKNSMTENNFFIIYFTQIEALIFFQTHRNKVLTNSIQSKYFNT